jgi:hypothetical protein
MSQIQTTTGMADNNYVAWALYTGPAKLKPLWENSRWVTGEWTGVNTGIKDDIDARIGCIIDAFMFARKKLSDKQKVSATNYFVIPEFFFRCKQGPYPNIKISGQYPYEYIRTTLQKVLALVPLLANEAWIFCAGSILACNETDFSRVLNLPETKERLDVLNQAMKKLSAAQGYENEADFLKHGSYIRALSYFPPAAPLSDEKKVIDDLMTQFRANPLCVVRNRGFIFKLKQGNLECFDYEKQNESTVDLTMGKLIRVDKYFQLDPGGMITEWMAGYPSISIIGGDKQCDKTPSAARITIKEPLISPNPLEMGIEICLDHRLKRLRRTAAMTEKHQANMDNPPLHIQLIPSGGMQIIDYSVSAAINGVIFNSDGCDPILDQYNDKGKKIIEGSGEFKMTTCGVYASSAQTMVPLEVPYYSHSQLSFRFGAEEMGGYNNALGDDNQKGATYDPATQKNPVLDAYPPAKRILVEIDDDPTLFATGFGEIHQYAKER